MITTLKKWGNGQGLRISKEMMKMLGIEKIDEKIKIEIIDNKMIIEKVDEEITLEVLFADYDGEDAPNEYDWGEAMGCEK